MMMNGKFNIKISPNDFDVVDGCFNNCCVVNIIISFKRNGNDVIPYFYPVDNENNRLNEDEEIEEFSYAVYFKEQYDKNGKVINFDWIMNSLENEYLDRLNEKQIERIAQSIILFNYLMVKLNNHQPIISIIEDWNELKTIGLMGPGYGLVTRVLECFCSISGVLKKHAVFHDVFGAIYRNTKKTNGYCYGIKKYINKDFVKASPLLGHITGIYKILRKDYSVNLLF